MRSDFAVKALSHVRKEKERKKERQRERQRERERERERELRLLRNTISSNPSGFLSLLLAVKDSMEESAFRMDDRE